MLRKCPAITRSNKIKGVNYMAQEKIQLKREEVVGDDVVLEDIYPKTKTNSITDSAKGTSLDQTISRMWNSINNKLNRVVNSVNGRTGVVVLDASDVGLGNVDDVSFADIKQWVIDNMADIVNGKRLMVEQYLSDILTIVEEGDIAYADVPFFTEEGIEGSGDKLSYIGFMYWDEDLNKLNYKSRPIRVVGYTDGSIIYNTSTADSRDFRGGGLGVNIWRGQSILKLKQDGESLLDQGLYIDEDKLKSDVKYFKGVYGDPENPADESALLYLDSYAPSDASIMIFRSKDTGSIWRPDEVLYTKQTFKLGDIIYCDFSSEGCIVSNGTIMTGVKSWLIDRQPCWGTVTQIPVEDNNSYTIEFVEVKPLVGNGLRYVPLHKHTDGFLEDDFDSSKIGISTLRDKGVSINYSGISILSSIPTDDDELHDIIPPNYAVQLPLGTITFGDTGYISNVDMGDSMMINLSDSLCMIPKNILESEWKLMNWPENISGGFVDGTHNSSADLGTFIGVNLNKKISISYPHGSSSTTGYYVSNISGLRIDSPEKIDGYSPASYHTSGGLSVNTGKFLSITEPSDPYTTTTEQFYDYGKINVNINTNYGLYDTGDNDIGINVDKTTGINFGNNGELLIKIGPGLSPDTLSKSGYDTRYKYISVISKPSDWGISDFYEIPDLTSFKLVKFEGSGSPEDPYVPIFTSNKYYRKELCDIDIIDDEAQPDDWGVNGSFFEMRSQYDVDVFNEIEFSGSGTIEDPYSPAYIPNKYYRKTNHVSDKNEYFLGANLADSALKWDIKASDRDLYARNYGGLRYIYSVGIDTWSNLAIRINDEDINEKTFGHDTSIGNPSHYGTRGLDISKDNILGIQLYKDSDKNPLKVEKMSDLDMLKKIKMPNIYKIIEHDDFSAYLNYSEDDSIKYALETGFNTLHYDKKSGKLYIFDPRYESLIRLHASEYHDNFEKTYEYYYRYSLGNLYKTTSFFTSENHMTNGHWFCGTNKFSEFFINFDPGIGSVVKNHLPANGVSGQSTYYNTAFNIRHCYIYNYRSANETKTYPDDEVLYLCWGRPNYAQCNGFPANDQEFVNDDRDRALAAYNAYKYNAGYYNQTNGQWYSDPDFQTPKEMRRDLIFARAINEYYHTFNANVGDLYGSISPNINIGLNGFNHIYRYDGANHVWIMIPEPGIQNFIKYDVDMDGVISLDDLYLIDKFWALRTQDHTSRTESEWIQFLKDEGIIDNDGTNYKLVKINYVRGLNCIYNESSGIDSDEYGIGLKICDKSNPVSEPKSSKEYRFGGLRLINDGYVGIRINDKDGYDSTPTNSIVRKYQKGLDHSTNYKDGTRGLSIDDNNVLGIKLSAENELLNLDNTGLYLKHSDIPEAVKIDESKGLVNDSEYGVGVKLLNDSRSHTLHFTAGSINTTPMVQKIFTMCQYVLDPINRSIEGISYYIDPLTSDRVIKSKGNVITEMNFDSLTRAYEGIAVGDLLMFVNDPTSEKYMHYVTNPDVTVFCEDCVRGTNQICNVMFIVTDIIFTNEQNVGDIKLACIYSNIPEITQGSILT